MKRWLLLIPVASFLSAAETFPADPIVPKRIDGGVMAATPDSLKELILACVPIKIVIAFVILEDGTTAELKVVEAEPIDVDTSVAMKLVSEFQYEPIIIDGVAIKSDIQYQPHIFDPAEDPNCNTGS